MKRDLGLARISHYDWVNIEVDGTRVGKMRVKACDRTLTIYSIAIFPGFQGRGYARKVIRTLQVIADRVRETARGFWQKMGFEVDGKGNSIWRASAAAPPIHAQTSLQPSRGSPG